MHLSLAPAGWSRQCSSHPSLLWGLWGREPLALLTVLAALWCLASLDLQDSQNHPSAPSVQALQPFPAFLAAQSPEAQILPSPQEGQVMLQSLGHPHPEGWVGSGKVCMTPLFPL